jgi:Rps23 Pro-64 3,4-dihydroxylase Tpa1-like proline 4-hydroxylase
VPRLVALKQAIYSPAFRALVSEIAGCPGELVDRTDLSGNLYMQGSHLLCHDDVIGTRKGGWCCGCWCGASGVVA